jgi:hypothetical protein
MAGRDRGLSQGMINSDRKKQTKVLSLASLEHGVIEFQEI